MDNLPLAGRFSRLGAALIDVFIGVFIFAPALLTFGITALIQGNISSGTGQGVLVSVLLSGVGLFGVLGIQVYLLLKEGQTIGKWALNIRIVDHNDGTLTDAVSLLFLRFFAPALISVIPYVGPGFAVGDVLFIFNGDRRCIHDHFANTTVINGLPVDEGDESTEAVHQKQETTQ